jgi:hypothetical protein
LVQAKPAIPAARLTLDDIENQWCERPNGAEFPWKSSSPALGQQNFARGVSCDVPGRTIEGFVDFAVPGATRG